MSSGFAHIFPRLLEIMTKVVENRVNQVFRLISGQQKEAKQHLVGRLLAPSHALRR